MALPPARPHRSAPRAPRAPPRRRWQDPWGRAACGVASRLHIRSQLCCSGATPHPHRRETLAEPGGPSIFHRAKPWPPHTTSLVPSAPSQAPRTAAPFLSTLLASICCETATPPAPCAPRTGPFPARCPVVCPPPSSHQPGGGCRLAVASIRPARSLAAVRS
ncbi:hypothetical protein T484DRAFT_1956006 [Baffinella frigidus]|nr:hypothetical protein T484DRAFT_1956006 [Cryptophyta sp. CCMP2293]